MAKTMTPAEAASEQVVQVCAMQGDLGHSLVVLTSTGRLFERVADPRVLNQGPHGAQRSYLWRPIKGPLDE